VNTIGDPSTSSDAVAVGATISKKTALADYGAPVTADQAVQNFSSRGPREDGGFKPNIVAPGAAISTVPLWLTGLPTPGVGYTLPPGYALLQGTSMASPQAAGGAALLLSAAKSRGIAVTPAALRRTIYTSASWLPGTAAHAQGNGLLDVPAAWSLLQGSLETRTYAIDAPVCTPLSAQLATPNHGVGIYNRCTAASGGQRPGGTLTYPVTVTRTSGPAGAVTTALRWVGDDGTFSSAGTISLPLNTPVALPVTATPQAGVHSAVLRIDDPSTAMVDAEMLNTVIAASQELNRPPLYTNWWSQLTVARNTVNSTFVNVPAGTTALELAYLPFVTTTEGGDGQLRMTATNPLGLPADDDANVCYSNYSADCRTWRRTYTNPVPGIWEFRVESRRTSPEATSKFSLSAVGTGLTYTNFVKGSGQCGNHWLLDGNGTETNGTGSDMDLVGGSYGAEGRKPNGRTAVHFSGASGQGLVARGVQQMRPTGFNVAAWVRMEDNTRDQTIVGEYGPESGVVFELGYRADLGAWSFTTTAEDGSTIRLTSTAATQPRVWTNIIVSYYEYRGFILYVNGKTMVAQSAIPRVGYPEFTSIGRTHWKNVDRTAHPDKPWSGSISDVCIGAGYISEDQAKWFANPDFDIVNTPAS
jgi:hypothetical protein